METFGAYLPLDRRRALAAGRDLPERADGAALFADVSGFTALTAALTRSLGLRRGAEELPRHLDDVYDALIQRVQAFGGSVIGFAGDAITCWFEGDDGRHATSAALALQHAMGAFAELALPDGSVVSLKVKVSVARGPVRRLLVGDPAIQRLEVIAGATVARLATAEGVTSSGEVVVDEPTAMAVAGAMRTSEWRVAEGQRFAVVDEASVPSVAPAVLPEAGAHDGALREWLLPTVHERLRVGLGEFLTELRPVVALFLSFTGIDYDHDEAAGRKLDAFVRWVQREAARYEATLLQLTVGDKGSYLYVACGAPLSHEDDARRAASVALALRDPPPELGYIADLRLGMSQGTMRTGAYGGPSRRTYGALGNETNMAARLMGKAAPGQILATEKLFAPLRDAFDWRALPPVTVKGRDGPLPVYELVAAGREPPAVMRAPVDELPMVGREAELALLRDRLGSARDGHGRLVGLSAEAGMGKSRLVAELLGSVREGGVTVLGGAGQSFGRAAPYLVWRGVFTTLLGLEEGTGAAAQIARAGEAIDRLAPQLRPRLPLLGPLLNLAIPENELTRSLDAELHQASREAMLVDLIRVQARRSGDAGSALLIVLEDLHWIDPLSRDLLEALSRVVADLPLLIVTTYRPPDVSLKSTRPPAELPGLEELELRSFTAAEAERLVGLKLTRLKGDGATLPEDVRLQLLRRAEGNPFYLEELLNYLFDQGLAGAAPGDVDAIEWPSSLHSLILGRIDRLTERQKATLKAASVIGRLFHAAWLHGYQPSLGGGEVVGAELEVLRLVDMLVAESAEPLAYLFKQVITRDVTYESIPYGTRAALHGRLARFVEGHLVHDGEPHYDLLAYHYELSDDLAKKRHYLKLAGEAAQASYANDTALAWYRRLLPLVERGERVDVLLRLGQVETLVGRYDLAGRSYERALALAEEIGERSAVARGMRLLGELLEKQGDYPGARDWLERAEEACHAVDDRRELVAVLLALGGNVLWQQGEYATAERKLQEALRTARDLDDARSTARALHGLGNIDLYEGDTSEARRLFEESLAIRREIGDRLGLANALNNLGIVAATGGDAQGARDQFAESLQMRREIGDRAGIAVALNNLGFMASELGDQATAEQLYEESLGLRRELGDRLGTAISLNGLGNLALERDDVAGARRRFRESLEITHDIGSSREAATALTGLAAVAVRGGADARRATTLAAAAERLLTDLGAAMDPDLRALHTATLETAAALIDTAALRRAEAAGGAMSLETAVAEALRD